MDSGFERLPACPGRLSASNNYPSNSYHGPRSALDNRSFFLTSQPTPEARQTEATARNQHGDRLRDKQPHGDHIRLRLELVLLDDKLRPQNKRPAHKQHRQRSQGHRGIRMPPLFILRKPVALHRDSNANTNRRNHPDQREHGIRNLPQHKQIFTPPLAQRPPPKEKEPVHPVPLRLVHRPRRPRRHRVEHHRSGCAKPQQGAHDHISGTDAAEVGEHVQEVEVRQDQGQRVDVV